MIRIESASGHRLKTVVTLEEMVMASSPTRLLEAKAKGLATVFINETTNKAPHTEAA